MAKNLITMVEKNQISNQIQGGKPKNEY